jgi:hypothetical protein
MMALPWNGSKLLLIRLAPGRMLLSSAQQRKIQGVVFKKYYSTCTPIVGYVIQFLFVEIFCKVHGLARRGFPAKGGQPEDIFFSKMHKNHSGS